ncbi:MAG TPA: D-alanyl-D-alanine carboxypeptidase, partial [Ruminococcus sp.]|nr:D-alanyl-D-alanine carboxypeptidase [Ruminococcus sp.]
AGMMMASGNDAANAAAFTVAGSSEKFADRMNERASQIGMKDTHFVTPSGLDDDNHYSTAYDMALLMSYALENDDFAKLTSQKSATVNFINPADKKTTYANHNKLLSLYDYCIGGKTGYTMAAGRCLVSAAQKDGLTLVCVTLNDRNDWNDHISLYDYGFANYTCFESKDTEYIIDVPCTGGTTDTTTVVGEKNMKIVLPASDKEKIVRKVYCDSFLYAPIKENQPVGVIEYTLDNEILASNNLIAMKEINSTKENKSIFTRIKELFTYG